MTINLDTIDRLDLAQAELALGRILRLASRPEQPGDIEEYERCRSIILNTFEPVNADYRPDWARDRLKGAQGDA